MIVAINRFITRGHKGKRGFTLLELMVTVGIVALAAGFAIPSFLSWLPSYRVLSAARDMGSTFQLARLKAATNTAEYRVVINLTNPPFSVNLEKGNAPLNSTVWTCEPGQYQEFHDVITNISVTPGTTDSVGLNVCRADGSVEGGASGHTVIFRPNGSTNIGAEVLVQLTNKKGNRFQVSVANTTGRVRVEKL
ncbi:MAG: prepilin-type N-terminal cleavage/methylation domain-containing protein [Pseudomonadota bacterium]